MPARSEGRLPAGLLPWKFEDGRIMSADGRTTLVELLAYADWAAVTDSKSRNTAWLSASDAEQTPFEELEEGRRWIRKGIISGPGAEVSEWLADKQLMRYRWEVVRDDENSITVSYRARLIEHVVFASFSNFRILLPLSSYLGAKGTVDEVYGGVILEDLHGGLSHPSYLEGPAQSLRLEGKDLTLELSMSEGGFTWTSLIDGRALAAPDTSLIIALYPSVAGPREKLGTLARRGTTYSASFTIKLVPSDLGPPAPVLGPDFATLPPAAALPPAVVRNLDRRPWELEPFAAAEPLEEGSVSFGNRALRSDMPLDNRSSMWKLEVGGRGEPTSAFFCVTGPVKDFFLRINGTGNFRDPRDLLDQLEPLPQDSRARAEKIWRYAATVTYAMGLDPTYDLGEFLGSYGYGFCSTLNTTTLVQLWEFAGLSARRVFVDGHGGPHALGEVYYHGDWHAYDLHHRTFYVDPEDWSVASAAEISSRPDLVKFNRDADGRSPHGDTADKTAEAQYAGAELSYNPGYISFFRLLGVSLRKGETFIQFYRDLGRWAPSPHEPYYYANALLAFCPDLGDANALEGFSQTGNLLIRDGSMVPEDPKRPAWFEYRAESPYVIVESKFRIGCVPSALERASLLISKDEGKTWTTASLDRESGTADLTGLLVPSPPEPGGAYERLEINFRYIVHFELAPSSENSGARIDEVAIMTWSQTTAALLPLLRAGDNEIEAKCGEFGPGASLSMAWIETDLAAQPDRPFQGEPFRLRGEVFNKGESPDQDFTVNAYAQGASGPVKIGDWRPEVPLKPGEKLPFEISCKSLRLEDLYPDRPPHRMETAIEIVHEESSQRQAAWDARTAVEVDFRCKPDLVVVPGLIKVVPPAPSPGRPAELEVLVKNFYPSREFLFPRGTAVPSSDLALYELDGEKQTPIQRIRLGEIPAGDFALARFRWTAPSAPGTVKLLVVADPDDDIDERDERNSASLDVDVRPSHP